VEAFPLPDQEAKTVADRFVREFVCRYGTPRKLFTDQGSNFQSKLFKEVCQLLEIDKNRTTPYHPQSDGLVERMNRTIEAMLSMFTSPGQRDWDLYLPYIMMAYRSAVQDTTGYSPNRMMLGREAEIPLDLVVGKPPGEDGVTTGVAHVEDMREKMEEVHNVARARMQIRSDRQKRNYDLKAQRRIYEKGEAVWLHNPARKVGISPKLTRAWEGPYLVIHRLSDVTYRIQRSPRAKMKVVHFDRLKPYLGDNAPAWNIPARREELPIPAVPMFAETESGEETIIYDHLLGAGERPLPAHPSGRRDIDNTAPGDQVVRHEMEHVESDETIMYDLPMEAANVEKVESWLHSEDPGPGEDIEMEHLGLGDEDVTGFDFSDFCAYDYRNEDHRPVRPTDPPRYDSRGGGWSGGSGDHANEIVSVTNFSTADDNTYVKRGPNNESMVMNPSNECKLSSDNNSTVMYECDVLTASEIVQSLENDNECEVEVGFKHDSSVMNKELSAVIPGDDSDPNHVTIETEWTIVKPRQSKRNITKPMRYRD
jgi:hypothetical protein